MPEIRLHIPEEVARRLLAKFGPDVRLTDIVRDALALFNWAIQEKAAGRVLLSGDENGEQLRQLIMPLLEQVKP